MPLHVDVVSAEAELYSDDADMVFVQAEMGEMGITPQHAPLLTRLKPGPLRVQYNGSRKEESFFVSGGILEVQPHLVTILANTAERAENLDRAAAEEARSHAREVVDQAVEHGDREKAEQQLAEAEARLKMVDQLKADHSRH